LPFVNEYFREIIRILAIGDTRPVERQLFFPTKMMIPVSKKRICCGDLSAAAASPHTGSVFGPQPSRSFYFPQVWK
jgi:hypothetical protein